MSFLGEGDAGWHGLVVIHSEGWAMHSAACFLAAGLPVRSQQNQSSPSSGGIAQ